MTQTTIRTMPAHSGDFKLSGETRVTRASRQRNGRTVRRRWLMLFGVVLIVVVAVLANIGPLTHFQDASARLDKVTGKVEALEVQRSELQSELAKLNESGYLETLARQQLTYAREGEDVYIITGTASDGAMASNATATGSATADPWTAGETTGLPAAERPGFLERMVLAIRGLF